jgi:tetratricopeptide (TPR) repeat protein
MEGQPGGRYRLVTELLDPSGRSLATRSTDFDITPRTTVYRPWVMRDSINGEETGRVLSALAEQYVILGDMAKARDACERAVRDNPGLVTPRLLLGRMYLDENRAQEAVGILEPAYAQGKDNVDLLLTLGDAYVQVENYERAAELLEAALILRRPDTTLLNALAVCYAELGDKAKSLSYVERSLELDPDQEAAKKLKQMLEAPQVPQK